jgi:hypothetical protein
LVELEQRSPGLTVWAPDDKVLEVDWPKFILQEDTDAGGQDIYCGVSLARQVEPQLKDFLTSKGFQPALTMFAEPIGGPSQSAVKCGAHAALLAAQLVARLQELRTTMKLSTGRLHLFLAAPNGFSFELGRHAGVLGRLTLYEYDFGGQFGGGYAASLTLP